MSTGRKQRRQRIKQNRRRRKVRRRVMRALHVCRPDDLDVMKLDELPRGEVA